MNFDAVMAIVTGFEGDTEFMYRDTSDAGLITIGVGHQLGPPSAPLPEIFQLKFVHDTHGAATRQDVQADIDALAKLPHGAHYRAHYYKNPPTIVGSGVKLTLPTAERRHLLRQDLKYFVDRLRMEFYRFDSFPEPAQEALLDMAFNLGFERAKHPKHPGLWGYPILLRAVRERRWTDAAAQCHRRGPSEGRNHWTELQFKEAARVDRSVIR